MAIAPVRPYEGREPYIFISYSHRDSDRVFPILKRLDESGYRIWYDEGIDPGTEWPESIAQHLMHSAVCIAFVSDNSLASQNCRREINFALSRNQIGFLSVMLEDAKMTPGVELQLSTYQSLLMYKYSSKEEFYDKLLHVDLLEPCKRPQPAAPAVTETAAPAAAPQPGQVQAEGAVKAEPAAAPVQKRAEKPEKPAKPVKSGGEGGKNKKPLIIGGAAAAVVALIVAIILMTSGKSDSGSSTEGTPAATQEAKESESQSAAEPAQTTEAASEESGETTQAAPETGPAVIELSDKLSDYTFKLDDVVYQLPFSFSKLTENGWTISTSGVTDQTVVAAEGDQSVKMVKNGASIDVWAVNAGKEEKTIADCQIGGIEVQQRAIMDAERFCIAKEITPFSVQDDVTAAFGTGATINTMSTYTVLTYGAVKHISTRFEFYNDSADYTKICVYNYPSAQQGERLSELSDNLSDFTFKLDGTVYQLPFPFADLTANGWTISTAGVSDKTLVGGYNDFNFEMSKNGATVTVYAINAGGNARAVADCQIGGIEVRQKQILDADRFCAAKGITPFSTLDEIRAAFGEPDGESTYSNYTGVSYGKDNIKTHFTVYNDTVEYNRIVMQNYPTEPEPTDTVTEVPEYLAAYTAPAALGDDVFSGIVEIDGDLYQLPAPVSAFLDNGWTVSRKSGFVAAFTSDTIALERDGGKLDLSIRNLAEVQTVAENCVVIKAEMNADNAVTCTLPQDISIGLRKSFLEDKGIDFSVSEFTNYNYYYKYEKQTGVTISLRVTKEDDQVGAIIVESPEWKY